MKTRCPVCGGSALETFLTRSGVPVHQNLLFETPQAAKAIARGDLRMTLCRDCEFVFNAAFDESKLQYGAGYENDQTCSPTFHAHVNALARMLVEEKGVRRATIVEVGSGNGYFLRRLAEWPGAENRGVGFDPSYRGPASELDGRVRFERRFYGPDCTDVAPDVVLSRHVIEHIGDPVLLIEAVRGAVDGREGVRLFLETPCVEWILRGTVIWDFFYEHCSLFTSRSLATLVRRGGFAVDSVRHVFDGQYLWLEATTGGNGVAPPEEGDLVALARAFADAERAEVESWKRRIRELAAAGPLAVWGAGAKGVTFAGLVDDDGSLVHCLIDINPQKQGKFVPVTGHPILGFEEAAARGVRRAILMNPNYRAETVEMLRGAAAEIELIA